MRRTDSERAAYPAMRFSGAPPSRSHSPGQTSVSRPKPYNARLRFDFCLYISRDSAIIDSDRL